MSETRRLIFPCGAYFPVNEWPVEGAHYAASGAVRMNVFPGDRPYLTQETLAGVQKKYGIDYDGKRAPCEFFCPTPGKRKEERGWNQSGARSKFISCFAMLYEKSGTMWVNVTPRRTGKCFHCEEQKSFVLASRRAVREKRRMPDRERFRLCPGCSRYEEILADTGVCADCQKVRGSGAS